MKAKTISILVDKNGNPVRGKYGPTFPMHCCAFEGNLKEIKDFIALGVNMNCRDRQGRTPLHEACCKTEYSNSVKSGTSLDFVKLLVDNGAHPLATDELRETPLHCVARHRKNRPVAAYLVNECKVTITCLNKFGQTPLDVAKESSESLLSSLKIETKSLTAKTPHMQTLPEVLQFLLLHDSISNRSLRELAREKITICLMPYKNEKLDKLPLPSRLKCYVGGTPYVEWMKHRERIDNAEEVDQPHKCILM